MSDATEITTSLGYQIINHDINYNITWRIHVQDPKTSCPRAQPQVSVIDPAPPQAKRITPSSSTTNLPRHTIEAHPSTCVFRRPIYGFSPKRSKAPKAPKASSHPPKRAQQSQYAKCCTPSACRSSTGKKKKEKKKQHHPPHPFHQPVPPREDRPSSSRVFVGG